MTTSAGPTSSPRLRGPAAARIAYWHDAGRAHASPRRAADSATEWLSRLGALCARDACDALGRSTDCLRAPASRLVELRSASPSARCRSARVEPFGGPGPLLGAVRHLRGLGL
jgi:hypothetical protein